MGLPPGVNPFDYFAALPEEGAAAPSGAKPQAAPAATGGSMLGWQDLPELLVPVQERGQPSTVPGGAAASAEDLRIALIVQNMAGFGAARGESELRSRHHESPRIDHFA